MQGLRNRGVPEPELVTLVLCGIIFQRKRASSLSQYVSIVGIKEEPAEIQSKSTQLTEGWKSLIRTRDRLMALPSLWVTVVPKDRPVVRHAAYGLIVSEFFISSMIVQLTTKSRSEWFKGWRWGFRRCTES